jgi:CysZ protein
VYFITAIIAAPFNDLLSEEVERIRTGREGAPFSLRVVLRDSVRTVGLELVKLLIWASVMGPLFLASLLLPVVGQILYTVIGFVFTAMYWSIDYVDWPASRQNRGVGFRFGMATRHFLPMFGFGTGVWLFLFIPFLNLLFMPAAVAGGTLLFLDLEGGQDESPDEGLVEGRSP